MAFNMLDDDILDTEEGYTPSVISGSRTGGMKKFVKKEERPQTALTLQKPAAMQLTAKDNIDDIDDLLDQLIDTKQKSNQKRPQTSTTKHNESKNSTLFDDLKFSDESAFGPKESITFTNQKTTPMAFNSSKHNLEATSTLKLSEQYPSSYDKKNQIISEEPDTVPFKSRRQSFLQKDTTTKLNIIEDDAPSLTIGSSRMMRPPMGRKPSTQIQPSDIDNRPSSLAFSLIPEAPQLTQTAEPGRLGRRNSGLSNQSPTVEPSQPPKEEIRLPNYSFDNPSKPSSLSATEKPQQRIVQRVIEKIVEGPKVDTTAIKAEHLKQLNLLKESYERQMKHATENFERQMKAEKDSGNKIIGDLKEILGKEKQSHNRVIEEEIASLKKVQNWEKEKMETLYKSEIERLKSTISKQDKMTPEPAVSYLEKRRVEDMEQKLKYQLDFVDIEKKRLSQVEKDLEQRQEEFKKFKALEERKLKDEMNSLLERDQKGIKKVSEAMNQVATQKQRLAVEMAQLENHLAGKREEINSQEDNLRLNRENFERAKQDSDKLSQQMYNTYKAKLQEVEESKKNSLLLENELLNKLKIVELKGKDVYKNQPSSKIFATTLTPQPANTTPLRAASMDRNRGVQENMMRLKNAENYMKQEGTKSMSRTFMSQANNSNFTLDNFMKDIDGYKKEKKRIMS